MASKLTNEKYLSSNKWYKSEWIWICSMVDHKSKVLNCGINFVNTLFSTCSDVVI